MVVLLLIRAILLHIGRRGQFMQKSSFQFWAARSLFVNSPVSVGFSREHHPSPKLCPVDIDYCCCCCCCCRRYILSWRPDTHTHIYFAIVLCLAARRWCRHEMAANCRSTCVCIWFNGKLQFYVYARFAASKLFFRCGSVGTKASVRGDWNLLWKAFFFLWVTDSW